MNPDNILFACATVAGITATLIGGLAAITLKLILGKVDDLGRRIGSIESVLIKKGLHESHL